MRESTLLLFLSSLAFSATVWRVPYLGGTPRAVEYVGNYLVVFSDNFVHGYDPLTGQIKWRLSVSSVDQAVTPSGFVLLQPERIKVYGLGPSGPIEASVHQIPCENPLYISWDDKICYTCEEGAGCLDEGFVEETGQKSPPFHHGGFLYFVSGTQLIGARNGQVFFKVSVGHPLPIPPMLHSNQLLVPVENRLYFVSPNSGQIYAKSVLPGWIRSLRVEEGKFEGITWNSWYFSGRNLKVEDLEKLPCAGLKVLEKGILSPSGLLIQGRGRHGLIPFPEQVLGGTEDGSAVYLVTSKSLLKFLPEYACLFYSPTEGSVYPEGEVRVEGESLGGVDASLKIAGDPWKEVPPLWNFTFEISNYPYGEVPIQCRLNIPGAETFVLRVFRTPDAPKKMFFPYFPLKVEAFSEFTLELYDENGEHLRNATVKIGKDVYLYDGSPLKIRLFFPGSYSVVITKKGYYTFARKITVVPPALCLIGLFLGLAFSVFLLLH